jgi:UDP-glucose:glycoprotein glucosyltransferase
MKYLSLKEASVGQFNVLTAWLVADLETDHGRDMLKGGIAQVKSSSHMRLGIIHNIKEQPGVVSLAIQAAVETQTNKAAKTLINKILNPKTVKALKNGDKSVFDYDIPDADMEKLKIRYNELKHNSELFEAHKLFAKTLPNFEPGEGRGVLLNGLVIGPLDKEEKFDGDDFHLLEKFAHSRYGEKLTTAFYNSMNVRSATDNKISDKAMKIVTLLINRPESDGKKSRQEIVFYGDKHSAITLEPNYPDQPAFDIVAIADPTTLGAQKMSSVLRVLQKVTNSKIKVFLNCVDKHSEMPQKSYFSMVLDPELYFTEDGNLS